MARKREVVTLSLSAEHQEALERIALEMGCKWGEKPNLSELLRQIAAGELVVSREPVEVELLIHRIVGMAERIKGEALNLIR